MKIDFEKEFLLACDVYCKDIDRFHIASTFAPKEEYSIINLKNIYNAPGNALLVIEAKDSLLNHIKHKELIIENEGRFFLDYEGISNYLFEKKGTKLVLYNLLKLAYLKLFYNERIKYDSSEIDSVESLRRNNDKQMYYRGQNIFDWRLSPSVLRGLNKNIIFDDNYYHKLLKEDGSEDRYKELLKYDTANKLNRYDKYAFMQHARSYSPFIDFTKDSVIAASFALSNVSRINEFNNINSALFTFFPPIGESLIIKNKWDARRFIMGTFKINVINSNYFVLGRDYQLLDSHGKSHTINIFSLNDLIKALTPKVALIDIPSNDRMIYQKGLFLCFYDCLCLNDKILYELSPAFIKKDPILTTNKRTILKEIYRDRKYDYQHLMDPYLYFKE